MAEQIIWLIFSFSADKYLAANSAGQILLWQQKSGGKFSYRRQM